MNVIALNHSDTVQKVLPTGQPYRFGGKERMRDGGLNDYDYVARRLNSATGIWAQPDPMARDFAGTNPYVFCGANPIKFIDPSGKAAIYFKGEYIGSDGVDDDRTYVIPDPQGTLYTDDNYTAESVGFSEEVISALLRVVKDSNGNKNEFHANQDVYSLMIEIPGSEKSIGEMDDELSKYDPSSRSGIWRVLCDNFDFLFCAFKSIDSEFGDYYIAGPKSDEVPVAAIFGHFVCESHRSGDFVARNGSFGLRDSNRRRIVDWARSDNEYILFKTTES